MKNKIIKKNFWPFAGHLNVKGKKNGIGLLDQSKSDF